jgi:hypothetical protein
MNEMVLTTSRSASSSFLFLPFWFGTQKGEDGLSYSNEGSATHSLQCSDRRVNAGHKADPIGFFLALIDCPLAGVKPLVQPMGPLEIPLCILHRAQKLATTLL